MSQLKFSQGYLSLLPITNFPCLLLPTIQMPSLDQHCQHFYSFLQHRENKKETKHHNQQKTFLKKTPLSQSTYNSDFQFQTNKTYDQILKLRQVCILYVRKLLFVLPKFLQNTQKSPIYH